MGGGLGQIQIPSNRSSISSQWTSEAELKESPDFSAHEGLQSNSNRNTEKIILFILMASLFRYHKFPNLQFFAFLNNKSWHCSEL